MKIKFPDSSTIPQQLREMAAAVAEEGMRTQRCKLDGAAVALCFGVFNMQSFSKPEHMVLGLLFAAEFAADHPEPVIDFGDDDDG